MTATEKQKANLKPFKPGDDPRRNKKGRAVNSFDQLRREWLKIWNETMLDSNGKPIIDEATGREMTRLIARMRIATSSRNVKEFETALAYAYGKPKEQIDITSGGKPLTWKDFVESDDPNTKTSSE
jgi:hypothetical protein